MNKNMILVLVVLVVVSVIQAVQLTGLKSNIEEGSLKLGSGSKTPQVTTTNTQTSSGNLQDLPSMVGGC